MIDYIFNLGLPYVEDIGIVLTGVVELNPIGEFIGALIIGVLLYYVRCASWKLLVLYCKKVSVTADRLK